jgi:hypothetical protein
MFIGSFLLVYMRKNNMKKIRTILISILLVITVLAINVSAGDENNPEIQDGEDDIIGTLVKYPVLLKIFQIIGIVPMQSFEFMDVKSAWFYEHEAEPDYLFVSIKMKDLEYTPLRSIYAVRWMFNDQHYGVVCHTYSNGEFKWFAAGQIFGLLDNWAYKKGLIKDISNCMIDVDINIIMLKIPKDIIGNPNPGDVLTETNAWTGLRFISEIFTYSFGGELARDPTAYGVDYHIQY